MKITKKTQKELEQAVYSHAEDLGVPAKEARTEIKGFMRGASSLLVAEALGSDVLGLVKENKNLQSLLTTAQERFSHQLQSFHKTRG